MPKIFNRTFFVYLIPTLSFLLFTVLFELLLHLLICEVKTSGNEELLARAIEYFSLKHTFCFREHIWANLFFILLSILGGFFTGLKLNSFLTLRDRLVQSERRLHEAFNVVKEGVFEWAYPMDKVYVSESFFRMCGYDRPTQMISLAEKQSFLHPDDIDFEREQMLDAIANRTLANFQVRFKHRDGHYFPVHIRGKVYSSNALTQTSYIVGTIRDVSSDIAARESIDQLNSRLNSALQLTGESVFEISCPDLVVRHNISPNLQIAGFSVNSLIKRPLNSILSEAEFEQLRSWMNASSDSYANSETFRLDIILELEELLSIPVRLVFRKGVHDGQRILIMNIRDLTMEQDANINLMMLKMAADKSNAGLVIVRPSGGIYYHNCIVESIFCSLRDNLKIWTFLPDYDEKKFAELWKNIKEKSSCSFTFTQNENTYEVTGSYLNVASGFIAILFQDQTKAVEREQRLRHALDAELQANQKRLAVLNAINYELRKPLTGILGFADLLRDETLNAEERDEYVDLIIQSGNHLLKLWTSVLELTTLECGMREMHLEKTNLNSIILNLQNGYVSQMPEGVQFRIQKTLRDVDANCLSDESILAQIFEKLLENSIKFTKKGWIEVGYTVENDNINFYVADSGCGISSKIKSQIFEPFKNDILAPGNSTGTNGLGLTISKLLVELLHGQISLKDTPGGGVKFIFSVPWINLTQEAGNAPNT